MPLAQLQSAEGTVEQAIETVERWRSFDPLNEDIYLRLMQLHLTTGNRIAALKTYKTCVDILRAKISAKPSHKLVTLAESIRNASLPHRMKSHASGEPSASSVHSLLNVPFVGRAAEFSRLMSLYEQTSSGQPQVVLIEGEAGIGKSRLAAAFLDWARVQGVVLFTGRAYKISKRLPYQPLLDSLRVVVTQRPDLPLLLSEIWLAELSRLLPELRERYPHLPQPTADEAFASSRFFEALARLSQSFAAQAPLIIFIDDIQWTDEATLDALHYQVRRWTECATPALLLLVRRNETRSMDAWLAEGLANLKNIAPLTRMELVPLPERYLPDGPIILRCQRKNRQLSKENTLSSVKPSAVSGSTPQPRALR